MVLLGRMLVVLRVVNVLGRMLGVRRLGMHHAALDAWRGRRRRRMAGPDAWRRRRRRRVAVPDAWRGRRRRRMAGFDAWRGRRRRRMAGFDAWRGRRRRRVAGFDPRRRRRGRRRRVAGLDRRRHRPGGRGGLGGLLDAQGESKHGASKGNEGSGAGHGVLLGLAVGTGRAERCGSVPGFDLERHGRSCANGLAATGGQAGERADAFLKGRKPCRKGGEGAQCGHALQRTAPPEG